MLTIFGLGVLGLLGTGAAAKLGLVNIEEDYNLMGQNIHVEFSKETPIKLELN